MKSIPLTQGMEAIVDDRDYDALACHKWHASKSAHNYYAVRFETNNGQRTKVYMHRFIMQPPEDQVVHHKGGNSLHNCRNKLENVTQKMNLQYRKWSKSKCTKNQKQ